MPLNWLVSGFGQFATAEEVTLDETQAVPEITWQPEPITQSTWRDETVSVQQVVVLLDGSSTAAQALSAAMLLCKLTSARMRLLSSVKDHTPTLQEEYEKTYQVREKYLSTMADRLRAEDFDVEYVIRPGFISDATAQEIEANDIDLVITCTSGKSGVKHWGSGGGSRKLVQKNSTPILLISANGESSDDLSPASIDRIIVALDGSIVSERSLPYARYFAKTFDAELLLTSVPAVPETSKYRAPAKFVEMLHMKANTNMNRILEAVAESLKVDNIRVRTIVSGSLPARTIVSVAEQESADLIMHTSRGRGHLEILIGSVAQRVVESSDKPVFMIPVPQTRMRDN